MQRLFVVKDVFEIKQRGVVAIGPLDAPEESRCCIGDAVEIRRAGAVVARTVISGMTMKPLPVKGTAEVLLRDVSKADVGPGDEVWLCVENPAEQGIAEQGSISALTIQTRIGKTTLRLVTGDIADQDTEAVVTAAHWRLNKGTGTDGTIHTRGGPRIYEECQRIGGCPIGDAVITTGGDLKARHVIHAVGPVWRGGDEHEPALLASAYRRSLEVAVQHGLRSLSFPSISTGAFVYPLRLAAPIALRTILEFLEREQHSLDEVRMVLYSHEDDRAYPIFAEALHRMLSERVGYDVASPSDPKDRLHD